LEKFAAVIRRERMICLPAVIIAQESGFQRWTSMPEGNWRGAIGRGFDKDGEWRGMGSGDRMGLSQER
jgi:hypothetical protein